VQCFAQVVIIVETDAEFYDKQVSRMLNRDLSLSAQQVIPSKVKSEFFPRLQGLGVGRRERPLVTTPFSFGVCVSVDATGEVCGRKSQLSDRIDPNFILRCYRTVSR